MTNPQPANSGLKNYPSTRYLKVDVEGLPADSSSGQLIVRVVRITDGKILGIYESPNFSIRTKINAPPLLLLATFFSSNPPTHYEGTAATSSDIDTVELTMKMM